MSAAGEPLFHLVPQSQWANAQASGQPYFPSTYATDRFIHLTKDPALLLSVANHFYTGPPSTPCAPLFPKHFGDSEVQVMLTQATCRCQWRLRRSAAEPIETQQQGLRPSQDAGLCSVSTRCFYKAFTLPTSNVTFQEPRR